MNLIKVYCIGLFALFFVFSCSNEISENRNTANNILHFESEEQMQQELKTVFEMSTEEKATWASVKGFKSFGVQADLFYDKVNPESFKSEDEILQFVKKSKYLEITTDVDGEKSVDIIAGDNRLRYLINEEMILTVGDKAVKLIGKNTLSTCIDNLSELKGIDDISQVENNPDYIVNSNKVINYKSVAACALENDAFPRTGSFRLAMEVYAKENYWSSDQTVKIGYRVRSQKLWIIWFNYVTDISYSIDMRAFHNYQTFDKVIRSTASYIEDSGTIRDYKIEDEYSSVISWPNEIDANLRWGWYDISVATSGVSGDLKCGR